MSKVIQHDLFKVKADAIAVINAFQEDIITRLRFSDRAVVEELRQFFEKSNKEMPEALKDYLLRSPEDIKLKDLLRSPEDINQYISKCIDDDEDEDYAKFIHSKVFQAEGAKLFINLIKAVGGIDKFLELYRNAEYDKEKHLRLINAEKLKNINARYIILVDLERDCSKEVRAYRDACWSNDPKEDELCEKLWSLRPFELYADIYHRAVQYGEEKKFLSLAVPVYESPELGGSYLKPFQECQTAVDENNVFSESDMMVYITVYDDFLTNEVKKRFEVSQYIDKNYIEANAVNHTFKTGKKYVSIPLPVINKNGKKAKTFAEVLNDYIVNSKKKTSDIYNKIGLSRQAFSEYRTGKSLPKKGTIIELAIALCLSLADAERLLQSAGYAFLESDKAERILKQNIEFANYDITSINDELNTAGIKKLIGCIE